MVVRPPALPELLDDAPPRLRGPVLAKLELGAPANDLKPDRGKLGQRALIQRIRRVERLEPALGLIAREEPLLLGGDGGRILDDAGPALEDDRPVIGGGGAPPPRGDPVRRGHAERPPRAP